jgi:hypothetical protein
MMVGMNNANNETQVFLLVGAQTGTVAVYGSREDAEARRDKYNADPFIDSATPDPDAPYEVQTWNVV